jgi:hypothetical protein
MGYILAHLDFYAAENSFAPEILSDFWWYVSQCCSMASKPGEWTRLSSIKFVISTVDHPFSCYADKSNFMFTERIGLKCKKEDIERNVKLLRSGPRAVYQSGPSVSIW